MMKLLVQSSRLLGVIAALVAGVAGVAAALRGEDSGPFGVAAILFLVLGALPWAVTHKDVKDR